MTGGCYTNDEIFGTGVYTYSTESGPTDATVVGTQIGNDFGFKPLFGGPGISVDETTNPGSITITNISSGGMVPLQAAYEEGNTINTTTIDGPVEIGGDERFLLNNEPGLVMTPPTPSITLPVYNKFVGEGGLYVNDDVVYTWPPPLPVIPTNAVSYIEAIFVGYDVNNNNSITSKISLKFDPLNTGNEIKDSRVERFESWVRLLPILNGTSIDFILEEVVPVGETYKMAWYINSFTVPR